jgi:glutamyl-Q tRNA(Asp) synthetase
MAALSDSRPVFRFAPSPNGFLHLGHARSALINARLADAEGGRFLLRIEDTDQERSREPFVEAIVEDLQWLGLAWQQPVLRQSTRLGVYLAHAVTLEEQGLLYPCFCSRMEIVGTVATLEAATGAGHPRDPDGAVLYPGTCRLLSATQRLLRRAQEPFVLRLDMAQAVQRHRDLSWQEWSPSDGALQTIAADPARWGDAVIMRKHAASSYHLAVVVDDAFQGISHVVRGCDLFEATHLHVLLRALLGLPALLYHHHALILGADGRKLSKSEGATALRALREAGETADAVRTRALDGD